VIGVVLVILYECIHSCCSLCYILLDSVRYAVVKSRRLWFPVCQPTPWVRRATPPIDAARLDEELELELE